MIESLKATTAPFLDLWNHKLITIAGIKLTLGSSILALLILAFATRISRLVVKIVNKRLIEQFVDDKAAQNTYRTFAFYGALAGVITVAMTIAGIPLTVFTVVGGALAIGVGFGSQNIVNNFISGVILLVEQPIKVGDVVEVDGMSGGVLSIGTRSTKIKNADDKIYIVPNSFFLEKAVLNATFERAVVRHTIDFGVAYGSDVRKVEDLCLSILLNTEGVKQTPMPMVLFENFNESTLDFKMVFWADIQSENVALMKSDIRYKVNEQFKQLGIEMAFPQRDVYLKTQKALEVRVLS
jgi:small-conductance mechanosensitive channel